MARRTIASEIKKTGTALHSGVAVAMTLSPAASGTGIVFRRSDLSNKEIPALYDRVGETQLGTVIAENGASVGVIEHLMAAVAGAEIDDLLVTLDGPEPPILDGDALSYFTLLERAGVKEQPGVRRAIKVTKPVEVEIKDARIRLLPSGKRDRTSAIVTFIFTLILLPVSLLPTFYGYGGYFVGGVSLICSLVFIWQGFNLLRTREIAAARKLMFGSFLYLPIVQLMFLFDFIAK